MEKDAISRRPCTKRQMKHHHIRSPYTWQLMRVWSLYWLVRPVASWAEQKVGFRISRLCSLSPSKGWHRDKGKTYILYYARPSHLQDLHMSLLCRSFSTLWKDERGGRTGQMLQRVEFIHMLDSHYCHTVMTHTHPTQRSTDLSHNTDALQTNQNACLGFLLSGF